jgi:hypothetical protein
MSLGYKVSGCARHYLETLLNPWEAPVGACVPADLFPLPSQKTKAHIRGTLNCGTSGLGFIAGYIPSSSSGACLKTTTSASVGGTTTAFSAYTNTQTYSATMLPEDGSQYSLNGIRTRAVAAGLRVKYIGELAKTNGVVAGYEDPDRSSAGIDSMTWAKLNSNPYASIRRVGQMKDWDCSVCYSGPTDPRDLLFGDNYHDARGSDGTSTAQNFLLIWISGQPGDLYEFDLTFHIESIGSTRTSRTVSHTDPQGFSAAVTATKAAAMTSPLEPANTKSVWEDFKSVMSETLPYIIEGGKAITQIAFGDEVGGALRIGHMAYKAIEDSTKSHATRSYPAILAPPSGNLS